MFTTKLKVAAVMCLSVGLFVGTAGWTYRLLAGDQLTQSTFPVPAVTLQANVPAAANQDASKTKPVARAVALQFVSAFLAESDPAKVLQFFDPDADRKGRGKGTAVEIIKRELEQPRRLRESAKLREIVFFSTKEDVAKLAERYPGETMWGRLPAQIDQVKDGVGCLVVSGGPEEGTTGLGAFVFKKVGENYRIVYMDDN